MILGPLSIEPVIERLASQVPELRALGGAADMETAYKAQRPTTPAGYVLLSVDNPSSPTGSTMRLVQPSTNTFGVALALRDYQRSKAGAGKATTDLIRTVRAALLGWEHPDAKGAIVYLGGRCGVLKFQNAVLWWQETYAADYRIRK